MRLIFKTLIQEAADQLELQSDTASCHEVKQRLALLSHNIRGLIQVQFVIAFSHEVKKRLVLPFV
jgi:hypothetical protein